MLLQGERNLETFAAFRQGVTPKGIHGSIGHRFIKPVAPLPFDEIKRHSQHLTYEKESRLHDLNMKITFFNLPGELRNIIYAYTHISSPTWRTRLAPSIVGCLTRMRQTYWMLIQPNDRPLNSLVLANKQLRQEVLSHFFSTHQFIIEDGCYPAKDPLPFLRSLTTVKMSLRSLTIDCRWFPYFWNGAARWEGDRVWSELARSTDLESLRVILRPGAVCRALEEVHGDAVMKEWAAADLAKAFFRLTSVQKMCEVKVKKDIKLELLEEAPQWTGGDKLEEFEKKKEFLVKVNHELTCNMLQLGQT